MSKKITELQLISSITDSLNFPADNGIQTYRATALQMKNYINPGNVIQSRTSNYTLLLTDDIILCDTSGGGFTLTLPAASTAAGKKYNIKLHTAGNALVIDGNASETIDGLATHELRAAGEFIEIVCDGTAWYIIASEYKEVQQVYAGSLAAWPVSSGVWTDLTALNLSSGDWLCSGNIFYHNQGTPGSNSLLSTAITSNSGNTSAGQVRNLNEVQDFMVNISGKTVVTWINDYKLNVPPSTTTTYYLKGKRFNVDSAAYYYGYKFFAKRIG